MGGGGWGVMVESPDTVTLRVEVTDGTADRELLG